jgi:protein-S-isoprenylcysteine O-methyltransferase Ste14
MPIVALVGYTVFLALAFGLRAVLHHRETGASGFVGLTGRPFSIEWSAGVIFAIAVAAGGLAPIVQLLGLVQAWSAGTATAGIAFTALGIAGTFWAQLAMGRSWRVGVDHGVRTELVSAGPFRWVRNPIFTWMTLATVGLVLVAPNVLAVGSLAALLVALELQVRGVEEPYLLRTHGEDYRRYAAATGRFVPGIGRLA